MKESNVRIVSVEQPRNIPFGQALNYVFSKLKQEVDAESERVTFLGLSDDYSHARYKVEYLGRMWWQNASVR